MKTTNATVKVWAWNNDGKLIIGNVEVADMDAARELAFEWNRDNPTSRIDLIGNASRQVFCTKISAIY